MNTKSLELWQRIENFPLDAPGATVPFSARLARENRWPDAFTRRAIREYKRFAFLAATADHPVSPSDAVDQVWHQHLTYTESYWQEFCPKVLGRPLHHQPSKGGMDERRKFDDWYARTLASYRAAFDEEPPADIWPPPRSRAAESHDYVRVDRQRHWLLPKPRFRMSNPRRLTAGVGVVFLAMLCSGAMVEAGANPFNWRGPDFLVFYAVLFVITLGLAGWLRWYLRTPARPATADDLAVNGYELPFLNGGRVLAVNAAIARLIHSKAMRVNPQERRVVSLPAAPTFGDELEIKIYQAATDGGAWIADVRKAAESRVTAIAQGLADRGLLVARERHGRVILYPLLLSLVATLAGVIKIGIGINRGRPVTMLVLFCLTSLFVSLLAFARRPLRSRLGDQVLGRLKRQHVGARRLEREATGPGEASALPGVALVGLVGLFGMSALAGTELDELRKALRPPPTVDGGDGSSSSCDGGGGGCGGGCGGCGGD